MIRLLTLSIDESLAYEFLQCFAIVREHGAGEYLGVAKAILVTFPHLRVEFGWLDCGDADEGAEDRNIGGHA